MNLGRIFIEGDVVVVVAILAKTVILDMIILVVMDVVILIIMIVVKVITITMLHRVIMSNQEIRDMMSEHHRILEVHVIDVVTQAISQGLFTHVHIIVNFIKNP